MFSAPHVIYLHMPKNVRGPSCKVLGLGSQPGRQ